jgi:hypothetical protein
MMASAGIQHALAVVERQVAIAVLQRLLAVAGAHPANPCSEYRQVLGCGRNGRGNIVDSDWHRRDSLLDNLHLNWPPSADIIFSGFALCNI